MSLSILNFDAFYFQYKLHFAENKLPDTSFLE